MQAARAARAAGEDRMPIYITQGRYTRDAIKGMIAKPEDRADAVSRLLVEGRRPAHRLLCHIRRL